MNLAEKKYSDYKNRKQKDFGFLACGISKAEFLEEEARSLEKLAYKEPEW